MQQLKQRGPNPEFLDLIVTENSAERNREKRLAHPSFCDPNVTKAHFQSVYFPPPVAAMTRFIITSIRS